MGGGSRMTILPNAPLFLTSFPALLSAGRGCCRMPQGRVRSRHRNIGSHMSSEVRSSNKRTKMLNAVIFDILWLHKRTPVIAWAMWSSTSQRLAWEVLPQGGHGSFHLTLCCPVDLRQQLTAMSNIHTCFTCLLEPVGHHFFHHHPHQHLKGKVRQKKNLN